ncbi:MAG: hypothetical protein ACM359_04900 [Bacillota bacterium]
MKHDRLAKAHFCAMLVIVCMLPIVSRAQPPVSRAFRMGFTPFPHDMTLEAVQQMRTFLAAHADIIAIHLEGVPWAEALADKPFHPKMMQDWKDKAAAIPPGAKVYLAITPIDGGRKALATSRGASEGEPLPPDFRGKTFDDPIVRKAYLQYCRRAIEYFKPEYLAIGIEVNELYHHSPQSWASYASLHRFIYAEIKKEHPNLPICASFTVHNMLNPGWRDREQMLAAFKGLMEHNDLVAISFYPFMGGLSGQVDKSLAWLAEQFGPYNKPYAVAEMGQLAEKLTLPSLKWTIDGSPAMQADFHEKMLAFAASHKTAFVISFLYRDYDALWEKIKATAPEAFMVWRDCGLVDEKGAERPACKVWANYFHSPYAAPSPQNIMHVNPPLQPQRGERTAFTPMMHNVPQ